MFFVDTLAEMGKFMDSGGNVLWMIVILLFFMWTLIFERVWYLTNSCPRVLKIKIDAFLIIWYSLSVNVCAGATVIESPV